MSLKMITIQAGRRFPQIILHKLEDFIPYLKRVTTWRRFTPLITERLNSALLENLKFKNFKREFFPFLKQTILGCRSGHFQPEVLRDIFGWTETELALERDVRFSYDPKTPEDFILHLKTVSKTWRQ